MSRSKASVAPFDRRADRHRRSQRRRQDHLFQPDLRASCARPRAGPARRRRHHRAVGAAARAPGSAAPFSSPICFPISACRKMSAWPCRRARGVGLDMLGHGGRAPRLASTGATPFSTGRARRAPTWRRPLCSHGDQRKLEVAMLMALEPKVFMFDEPTAGMSIDEVPVMLDLIAEIKQAARQDHPAGRAQDGRGAFAGRPHHRAA